MTSLDIHRARQIWNVAFPDKPKINSDAEMLTMLHIARTASKSVEDRLRFYSHCWLMERGLHSALPDELRPSAERMYPRLARSVGISVNTGSSIVAPAVPIIRGAMEDAVLEAYDDKRGDDIPFIKERMDLAKKAIVKKLFGEFLMKKKGKS